MPGKGAVRGLLLCCFLALLCSLSILPALASGEERVLETTFIPAGQGAVLESSDGLVRAEAPAGIRAADAVLWYEPLEGTDIPPIEGYRYVGKLFGLGLMYPDGFPIRTHARPVSLSYNYSGADLTGVDESSLVLAYFDGYYWVPWPSTVDTVAKRVSAQADHLALTTLLGRTTPAAPPAPQAGAASSISGLVFYDRDGNGVFDGDDFPISTAGVRISSGDWSAFTTTGEDGRYAFDALTAGTFTVSLQVGEEWAFTTPSSVEGVAVTGEPGSTHSDVDFGMWYRLP